eukprot:672508-Rhodomonas_salina.1
MGCHGDAGFAGAFKLALESRTGPLPVLCALALCCRPGPGAAFSSCEKGGRPRSMTERGAVTAARKLGW